MVSKASEDLPEPESPVNTTSRSRGISRSMFLRLCSRAPRIAITRAPSADAWRRGRDWSKRTFIRSVARSIWGGQGGHTQEAKAKEASRRSSPRGAPKERSKNGGVSLARRAAVALPSLSCGQRPRHWPQCDVDTPERDGRRGIAGGRFNGRASMKDVIAFILGNFTLTFFVLGLLASAIALWRARPPRTFALVVEALFSYFVLFSIGFSSLYNFVLHVFFGKLAAGFIGWEDSPFQLEVGFASLGFAVVGLLAFGGSFDLRLAAIVGPACFLWGAAGGHVYQMITAHNFAPGNAGIIFYSDLLVPIVGLIFLWLQHRAARSQQRRSA